MDCEDKECMQKRKEVNTMLKKVYLSIEPDQIVYVVFASRREGKKEDIVIRCRCNEAIIYKSTTVYCLKPIKVVTKGNRSLSNYNIFKCENANIDTGYRGDPNRCPVFTEKEKCLKWLKDM
jgi:hypothetical protein